MIKAGIIGATGYTGGELVRILSQHPAVTIDFLYSTTRSGRPVHSAHPDLLGMVDMTLTDRVNPEVDVVFLCLGHGASATFLTEHPFSARTKIIDLSTDFRAQKDASFAGRNFVYGLCETQKKAIEGADAVANPGCFATAIQLALAPLAAHGYLQQPVHINATTGSTGAGAALSESTHFSWRNNSMSWYKAFEHQHLGEIGEQLGGLQKTNPKLYFLPQRGNFARGIWATAYTSYSGTLNQAKQLFDDFYADAPFTHRSEDPIHLKTVVNTNFCHLHLHLFEDQLLITSAIDNLLKGASGQAVQNMNLIFGWEENLGLLLKPSAF